MVFLSPDLIMKKQKSRSAALLASLICLATAGAARAQIADSVLLDIVKAEDALRFDGVLIKYLGYRSPEVRARAALAAGRIGDERAVRYLIPMVNDKAAAVSGTAMFAIGEIESELGAESVLSALGDKNGSAEIRALAVESAGKIAAANSSGAQVKPLGEAILDTLESEDRKGDEQDVKVILKALTAALRARPVEADVVIERFFTNKNSRVREDAANAYARVRGSSATKKLQSMLMIDEDPVARANAARALGTAGDKTAITMLLEAAETDEDLRVRVNALRALGSIAEPAVTERLLNRIRAIRQGRKGQGLPSGAGVNELLEAVSAIGRTAEKSANSEVLALLKEISASSGYTLGEVEAAIARVDPKSYEEYFRRKELERIDWRAITAGSQGYSAILEFLKSDEAKETRAALTVRLARALKRLSELSEGNPDILMAIPAVVGLYGEIAGESGDETLRAYLKDRDVFIRAAAASALADHSGSPANFGALAEAFKESLESDKDYNDAQMSMLSAIVKLDKTRAAPSLRLALKHYDYLVRKQARQLIRSNELQKEFPEASGFPGPLAGMQKENYSKLGQLVKTDDDYKRALARRNGKTKAVVTTGQGNFTIDLFPEDAPLTVDNFVGLAKKGYFNGLAIHRVVANFVVQDGDPRGDGNGGPGWEIRCEINMIEYGRGVVGMALSGKDTGGSQWFVTHSPQPHLDGGYTVFGRVSEEGMKIVDQLARGDVIRSIEVVE